MEFSELVTKRKMTREFSEAVLDPLLISELLDVVRYSPSAGFTQGFRFLALVDKTSRELFFDITSDKSWLESPESLKITAAPLIIIPFCLRDEYIKRYEQQDKIKAHRDINFIQTQDTPYWLTDLSFATMLLLLKAEDLGLGALFFAIHNQKNKLKIKLNIPATADLIGAVAVGYKNLKKSNPLRKRISSDQVIKYNTWN